MSFRGREDVLWYFLCNLYTPPYDAENSARAVIPPCRPLCETSRSDCARLMNKFGFPWPEQLDCSRFPMPGGSERCINRDRLVASTAVAAPPLTVQVKAPPTIQATFGDYIHARSGQTFHLDCIAEGNPKPSVMWRRKGTDEYLKNPLAFSKVDYTAEGSYECVASSSHFPETVKETYIDVKGAPEVDREGPHTVRAREGSSVTLTCRVTADPPTWFSSVSVNVSIILLTPGAPEVDREGPHTVRAREGSSVTLTCRVTSDPPAEYPAWFSNGREVRPEDGGLQGWEVIHETDQGKTRTTLFFGNVTRAHAAVYTCRATNKFGYAEQTFDMRIHDRSRRCDELTVPLCQGLPYNSTRLPNGLGHATQEEVGRELHQFWPLVEIECSPFFREFLCTLYATPCREDAPGSSCARCTPRRAERTPQGVPVHAVRPSVPRGRPWLSVNTSLFPGSSCARCTPLRAARTPLVKEFLCTLYAPPCREDAPDAVPPCREMCESSYSGCAVLMTQYGFKWPDVMNCSRFPSYYDVQQECTGWAPDLDWTPIPDTSPDTSSDTSEPSESIINAVQEDQEETVNVEQYALLGRALPTCEQLEDCNLDCEYGPKFDENQCPICECGDNPCKETSCGEYEVCALQPIQCLRPPCSPLPYCKPVPFSTNAERQIIHWLDLEPASKGPDSVDQLERFLQMLEEKNATILHAMKIPSSSFMAVVQVNSASTVDVVTALDQAQDGLMASVRSTLVVPYENYWQEVFGFRDQPLEEDHEELISTSTDTETSWHYFVDFILKRTDMPSGRLRDQLRMVKTLTQDGVLLGNYKNVGSNEVRWMMRIPGPLSLEKVLLRLPVVQHFRNDVEVKVSSYVPLAEYKSALQAARRP
ncbi:FZD8 [Branchiostoma lanceolatum]|uniref:FZD8 protein n=1 Tax=Branchiostoma lanceolatum TaxID=7740 RepID=A0A8J9ZIY7_BRALA|nr:FZD8 [Branchiostoma lanceolatum]